MHLSNPVHHLVIKGLLLPYGCATYVPLADGLRLLHGVSCSQDVLGIKGHHGLHLQDGGVGQSVVHAVFGSVNDTKYIFQSPLKMTVADFYDHFIDHVLFTNSGLKMGRFVP